MTKTVPPISHPSPSSLGIVGFSGDDRDEASAHDVGRREFDEFAGNADGSLDVVLRKRQNRRRHAERKATNVLSSIHLLTR